MTKTAPTPRTSFWRRTWQFLCDLEEVMNTTPTDHLLARVNRLERELAELKGSSGLHAPRSVEANLGQTSALG
jgi:hypothetical protein